jgi:hypothetical protein
MVDGNELRRQSNGNIDVGGGRWSLRGCRTFLRVRSRDDGTDSLEILRVLKVNEYEFNRKYL